MGTMPGGKLLFNLQESIKANSSKSAPEYDLWSSRLFPNFQLMDDSAKESPMSESVLQVRKIWEDFPNTLTTKKECDRLPVFRELTRRGLQEEASRNSVSHRGSNGWEDYAAEDHCFSQLEARTAADLAHVLKDDDSMFIEPEKPKQRLEDVFQQKQVQPKQWEHLRYSVEELNVDVSFLEGVFTRLVDTRRPPNAQERHLMLKLLVRVVKPENCLKLSVNSHSRRQLMFALEFLLREKTLCFHVITVLCRMFEDLDILVELDSHELVFAKKIHVFDHAINTCDMKRVVLLARCLLKTSWTGIGSTLGLALVGRLIERADSLDFKACNSWQEEVLPGLAYNVLKVKDITAAYRVLGVVSVKHLLNNLNVEHEMFNGSKGPIRRVSV